MKLLIRNVNAQEVTSLSLKLSDAFQGFFEEEPWCEYVICSNCKLSDDFGPTHSWGKSDNPLRCPVCKTQLTPYWTMERTQKYLTLHCEAFGRIAFENDLPVAWVWGYPHPTNPKAYYLDTVGILAKVRKNNVRTFFGHSTLFMHDLIEMGYEEVITRTHVKAKKVRLLLAMQGFKEQIASEEDPERTYWIVSLENLIPLSQLG